MIDVKTCVRCYCEVRILEYNEAEDYAEWLYEEGIAAEAGDAICDDCVKEVTA